MAAIYGESALHVILSDFGKFQTEGFGKSCLAMFLNGRKGDGRVLKSFHRATLAGGPGLGKKPQISTATPH